MALVAGDQVSSGFPCTQCGLCCQNVYLAEATRFLDRGDGTCMHYAEAERACSIYEQRPDICRVDRMYELHYAHRYTWTTFVRLNIEVCKKLEALAASAHKPI